MAASYRQKFLNVLLILQIHVEPVIFLISACNQAKGIVTPKLNEDRMNRTYVAPHNLTGKDMDKWLNKKMVYWDQNFDYINLPIALFLGIVYGGISDRWGRKWPLVIGLASVFVDYGVRMLIWAEQTNIPLHWLFVSAAITGLMGDFFLVMSCMNAYLADQFPCKKELSFRMIIFSIVFSLGQLFGSLLTDNLTYHISNVSMMFFVEGGVLICFIYSIIMLQNKIPSKQRLVEEHDEEPASRKDPGAQELPLSTKPPSVMRVVKKSFLSLWDSLKIFYVNRDGHKRLFLYLCFLANFLDQFVFGEEKGLIGTYTRLKPFQWSTHTYGKYKTFRPIVQVIGMIFGLVVLKRLLKLRDTVLIVLAIASMGLAALVIGLAKSSWLIFASLAPGSLHGLLNPLTYTFLACVVEPDEVGKAYAIASIAQKLAGIAQNAILQSIYTHTVDWYQGFIWLLMAGISFLAALIYVVVHFIAKRENIGVTVD